jgi:KTSC domain
MRPVHSSLLEAAAYHSQRATLELAFRTGAVYCYLGVPAQTYQQLLQAPSKGKYFNTHIRNCFPCAKQTAARKHDANS